MSDAPLQVDIVVYFDPDKPHLFSMDGQSVDGQPLTPQHLLDAFSDALLHTYGHLGPQSMRVHLDS